MNVLYWFESIRNPILNAFFAAITYLGHELIPIVLICVLYWCIDKKLAYKIGFVFFASGLATQALKITFRVDRPWIKDPDFKPYGDAVDEATSYSFPSGHTQAATSVYGTLALTLKKNWLRILCIVAFVLVGISRMYLGVHTPADVITAMALTLAISFAVTWAFDKFYDDRRADIFVSLILFVISAGLMIYAAILSGKGIISGEAAEDCVKSGGAGLAFAVGYFVERRYINFCVKCRSPWMQIIKAVIGLGAALGLKSGLKPILGDNLVGDGIRYFILVLFIVAIYPLILKAISKRSNCKK